ncbi:MAG: 30S ribosomal protein S19e [Candidatus Nanoarchaeia archaeon]|nr:30S ribosomal protein S19e [Candidatus Nanoarchaeia archaeon]
MTGINDIKVENLIKNTAEKLKSEIKPPTWATFVKTGAHKQRPPVDSNWWFVRAAAILRRIYLLGPIGTNKLANKYGGKRKKGTLPEKSYTGSRSIIRKILQQLEEKGYIAKTKKGVHNGRILTPKGVKLLAGTKKNESGRTKEVARATTNAAPVIETGAESKEILKQ